MAAGVCEFRRTKCLPMWLREIKASQEKIYGGKGKSRKEYTREYHVRDGEHTVQVCKEAFKSIFAISDGRINKAVKAQAVSSSLHSDQHGRQMKERCMLKSILRVPLFEKRQSK